MAVGVRYFGQGTRPRRVSLVGDDATGGGLGDIRSTDTGSSGQTLAAARVRAATDARQLEFDREKFDAEQRANEAAIARANAARQAQGAYLKGLFQTGEPSAYGDIAAQEKASQDFINTQATNLLARLGAAKETATGLTTTGYQNLRNYLTSNVPQAYATAQQAVPTVTANALAQYMAARGVGQEPVQAAVDVANAGLASSAGNYNQLLNVLRAQEASGQQSRLSEEQIARALAGANLEQTYGAGRAGVESEQAAALNALATQIANARLQAKAVQDARNQALQDALATLIGQGYTLPTETVDETVETVKTVDKPPQPLSQEVLDELNRRRGYTPTVVAPVAPVAPTPQGIDLALLNELNRRRGRMEML